ncbi:N-6 DNA methylase (plasmid) [Streptomyces sp. NBC_01460]|uniref:N-6 DNA methylase n=1 Tax=Streptomyces sp. NBC_01460 TaxID=2903875 RepID=UPI002E320765|nr:N-6 DNA methylase [Streptomyces sp. NBC_01460]
MSIADHTDQLHSQAEIAALAGVSRATITQWRRAPGFPPPQRGGESDLFHRAGVLAWLDERPVPGRLLQGDSEGTTFGARARAALAGKPQTVSDAPETVEPDMRPDPRDVDHVRALMGQLCERVRGAGSRVDYVNLLASLHFLRRFKGPEWDDVVTMSRTGEGSDGAAALLQHIAGGLDEQLRRHGMRPAMRQSLARLEPRSYNDLRHVVHLVGELGHRAFDLMLDEYELLAGLDSGEFFTPRAVADLMVRIAGENTEGEVPLSVYDPYTRGGELLAAATTWCAEQGVAPPRMEVCGITHGRDTAPLATMNLTLRGARPRVFVSSDRSPWNTATAFSGKRFDLVLSNPPFNMSDSTGEPRNEGNWPYGPPPLGNDNLAYVQHVLSSLEEGGTAAVIMPNKAGNSANKAEKAIRRAVVERGAMKAVVALPDRLFSHTSVPVSVWFLVHPSQACDDILFLDARQVGIPNRGKRTLRDEDVQAVVDAYRYAGGNRDGMGQSLLVPTTVVDRQTVQERDWSLSPMDHIDTHEPRRGAAEAAHAEVLHELEQRKREVREADLAAGVALERLEHEEGQDGPVEWERVVLSSLCGARTTTGGIQAGPSYSLLKKHMATVGGVPLVYPQNLREGRIEKLADDRRVAERAARSLDRFRLRPGDIVCVRTGAMGPPALVRDVGADWLMSTNVIRLRVDERHRDRVHPGYLAAYLGRPESVAWVRDRASATGAPSISAAALGNQPVLLPPYTEQQRVVAVLDALDAQAMAHSRLAEAVAATRTAVVERRMFSDLDQAARPEAGRRS